MLKVRGGRLDLKKVQRAKRRRRVRGRLRGSSDRPRLSVFRSNRHLYAQLIDDEKGNTLVAVSDLSLGNEIENRTKTEIATKLGHEIAKRALSVGVAKVSFDRGGYRYHGRVKALAEGARAGGLEF